jgi:glycosyltransferase involved in cell wall biosynthesis
LKISVLYIHHCGTFGGASRSLLELIKAFPQKSVKPHLITQKGNVVRFFENDGVPVISTAGISQFDNTRYGYYRRFRWLLLVREVFYCYFTFRAIYNARKKWKYIEIIHINEITNILSIYLSKIIFKKPVIVHIRSVQQTRKAAFRYKLIMSFTRRYLDYVITIDETVKKSLPGDLADKTIHNGFRPETDFRLKKNNEDNIARLINAPLGFLRIAMVGNLLKFKGVFEFIKAAKICIDKNLKINFYLVGDNVKKQDGFKASVLKKMKLSHYINSDVKNFVQKNRLNERIHFLNFTPEINKVYENIDILCFPSHLNAVGRPVLEAAFFKVPSIVAINDPLDDTIIDGETGICIESKDPQALAGAIEYFYSNPDEIKRMGESAYQLAIKNFDIQRNAEKVLAIYEKLTSKIHTIL